MTEHFNENVEIEGSQDVTQLRVQGHTSQTQPLQDWQNSAGDSLVRVTELGNFYSLQ